MTSPLPPLAAALIALTLGACSGAGARPPAPSPRPVARAATPSPGPHPSPAPHPRPPSPKLPPYAIEALRARSYTGGVVTLGARLGGTAQYTTYRITWPSQGGTMTGEADIPAGRGPFPVAVVDHGYIPAAVYRPGQDSTKYADAYAAAGILTVAPDYPGYAGSAPGEPDLVPIEAEAVEVMDLIGALPTLPQADPGRVSVSGHSNGGGVAELVMVIDARVRSVVLYAPVSTDMADNARKWWTRHPGGTGPLGSPDTDPAAYALISPRGFLRAGGPPVLVLQGEADEQIPAEWTAATVAALRAADVTTRFVSFPGATHNLTGADLARANALAVDWMRRCTTAACSMPPS
ncbi:MAG TPA: prolyl oligopeptidase family serine peptidase [Candidatus Dormibacteraeota bacterium]|nr:prolyl oligopeptidase family serine peptidase [Candidatus Dormibacteraeota bacterium]